MLEKISISNAGIVTKTMIQKGYLKIRKFSHSHTLRPGEPMTRTMSKGENRMKQRQIRTHHNFKNRYQRQRDLPQLLGLMPYEFGNKANILQRLEAALAKQRRAARQGRGTYSMSRHMLLIEALKTEKAAGENAPVPPSANS